MSYFSCRWWYAAGISLLLTLSGIYSSHVSFLEPARVFAEETIDLNSVQLSVWPEYDDPRLLVMWEGRVSKRTGTSTPLKFLLPKDAEIYFVGSGDDKGNYAPISINRNGSATPGYDQIDFSIPGDIFRVEYYQDAIQGNPEKSIKFEFRTLHLIKGLLIDVQQPLTASNYKIEPQLQSSNKSSQGITYYSATYDTLGPEKPFNFTINYTKSDSSTSVKPGSATTDVSGQSSSQTQVTAPGIDTNWIVLIVTAGIAGILVYWMRKRRMEQYQAEPVNYEEDEPRRWRLMRATSPQRTTKGSRSETSTKVIEKPRSTVKGNQLKKYCLACRVEVRNKALFCPYCGAELEE